MNKLLTISIAAYNVEKYIKQVLNSIVDEAFIDQLDIIINDDGGQDQTVQIAKKYEEKYPQSIRIVHKENGGYGSVINTNLELAKGKYFKQLDGDDGFDTGELPGFLSLLESTDADCILTWTQVFRDDTGSAHVANKYGETSEGLHRFDETTFRSFLTMHSVTFKTSAIQNKGIHITEHCFYTDVEFVNSALPFLETFYVYPHVIYLYRKGLEGQSVSWTGRRKHYKEQEIVLWKIAEIYKQEKEPHKKRLIANRLNNYGRAHLGYFYRFPISKEYQQEYRRFGNDLHQRLPEIEKAIANRSKFWKIIILSKYRLYYLPRAAAWLKDKRILHKVKRQFRKLKKKLRGA